MSFSEWSKYKFSDFVSINPTISLKGGGEFSFIEMKDLSEGKRSVEPSSEKKITGGARFREGNTLFAKITPCLQNGKIGQAIKLKNALGFGSTEFLVFEEKPKVSDKDFIYYLACWQEVRKFAEQNMVGTSGRQRVGKDAFEKLELTLPPLKTQQRIASILSSLDGKIELNRQTNQTLEAMAQTLFKEMCLPKDEVLEDGWRVEKLKQNISILNGYAFKGMDFIEKGVPVIKIKNVKAGKVNLKNLSYVSREVANNAQRFKINKNDLLITMSGNRIDGTPETWVGKVGIFHAAGEYLLNQRVSKLVSNNEEMLSKYYLCQLLSNDEFQYHFISNATSSGGQANISPDLINNIELVIPSIAVMKSFDEMAKAIYESIFMNEEESQTLTTIRDGLLPKLMKGAIEI